MKLYTEEEVNKAMLLYLQGFTRMTIFEQKITPIELPSDEEIDRMWPLYYTEFGNGLNEGAKQMRDKIQGGNNEQQ